MLVVKRLSVAFLILILGVSIYLLKDMQLYDAGDAIGYNLGLCGGVGMCVLLLYPLRKRFDALAWTGSLPAWFKLHIVLGIISPILIVFHTGFRLGSLNGSVAFYSMVAVAFSGIVGRFIYRYTHSEIDGSILTIKQTEEALYTSVLEINSELSEQNLSKLKLYKQEAYSNENGVLGSVRSLIVTEIHKLYIYHILKRDIRDAVVLAHLKRYLKAVYTASQLKNWTMLFSTWHIIHIPFLYLLVFSGIVHVIAVHMY